jgi:adenine-specific DNA-methyltransferase
MEKTVFQPFVNELPAVFADRLGLEYSSKVTQQHKKQLGQFFTPLTVAYFMTEFVDYKLDKIKILDPGCGTGVLACALIERLVSNCNKIEEIHLVAFETDLDLIDYTDISLKYLQKWLRKQKIKFTYFLCKNDFILHNSAVLINDPISSELYNIIIANPPYFKINKSDERAKAARRVIYGQSNIYSIFLLIAAKLLDIDGRLIFITPRSFTSGNYFKLFRERFFELIEINHIHLFKSRKQAFERDKVLQENIIVAARKKREILQNQLELSFFQPGTQTFKISTSTGITDVKESNIKSYTFSDLVNIQSEQKIIHIPVTKKDEEAIQLFKTWKSTLKDYEMRVSTGPVVDFRSLEFIRETPSKSTVPLIYLHNIDKMTFKWPYGKNSRGKIKGEHILYNAHSFSRLVRNKDYVLLRRFSSKDDRSRLIAAPYFSKWLPHFSMLGIENHLNYIYKKDAELTSVEILGLAGLLNSKLFDIYFRTFNGNINVSATELRHLPLPPKESIEEIGQKLLSMTDPGQVSIDDVVQTHFKIYLV